jgi:hypothetical protein
MSDASFAQDLRQRFRATVGTSWQGASELSFNDQFARVIEEQMVPVRMLFVAHFCFRLSSSMIQLRTS